MAYPNLPLSLQNDVEQGKSWEGNSTPHDLAQYMARVLSVDPNLLLALQEVVYSDVQPTGEDSKRIWIKTSAPAGIGIPTSFGYKVIYEYPANVPFLWVSEDALPTYVRRLTNGELANYSLTDPIIATAYWVIYAA